MISQADLQQFYEFAITEINNGGVASLEQCLCDWREFQETVAAIQEAEADIAAGRTMPVDEAFESIRRDLGLSPRRSAS